MTERPAMDRVERTARLMAARKMMLRDDPEGLRLPNELWMQCVADATAVLIDPLPAILAAADHGEPAMPEPVTVPIVSFAYNENYVVALDDIGPLLAILGRMTKVDRKGYSGPWHPAPEPPTETLGPLASISLGVVGAADAGE